ncbi:hypothetical protein [Photorhabdus sp. S14-60]|nr:hypothetical protein [Photorhabdus sp. S14-60]NDK97246.1 hypothetical protein [Photorhabdus laumondii subsp. laumondii]
MKKMSDDVTLSYYNVFFVIIYYAMSILVLIVLFKLREYVRGHIRTVLFTVIFVIVNTVQHNIAVNGGVLVYIFPHYFSIYDYRSIRFGALFFAIAYSCLLTMNKSDSEEKEKEKEKEKENN